MYPGWPPWDCCSYLEAALLALKRRRCLRRGRLLLRTVLKLLMHYRRGDRQTIPRLRIVIAWWYPRLLVVVCGPSTMHRSITSGVPMASRSIPRGWNTHGGLHSDSPDALHRSLPVRDWSSRTTTASAKRLKKHLPMARIYLPTAFRLQTEALSANWMTTMRTNSSKSKMSPSRSTQTLMPQQRVMNRRWRVFAPLSRWPSV